jgi:pimeloyl-ACP methyl ester carboxylesterase
MSQLIRIGLVLIFSSSNVLTPFLHTREIQSTCEEGVQASGALYLICMPEDKPWNGDLVIFSHGYTAFNEPIELPDLSLPDGTYIPDLVNGLGYAFATTSYSTNGLAVLEGIDDVVDLVAIFVEIYGEPDFVYLTGGSEGGIITTLAVERFPEVFDGGLAACGPIGDFQRQVNYWGDFRVVFDVFFPELIPGSAIDIPGEVIENWEAVYVPSITKAIGINQSATEQLLNVTSAPIDPNDPVSVEETVLQLLWYNVFATNDGIDKLGGQPFGNRLRIYNGSANDRWLNRQVQRFRADRSAIREIQTHYQTSGVLSNPLVTIHTTGDPVIPYWHSLGYLARVIKQGSGHLYSHIPVIRYGHCEFTTTEFLVAFALLVLRVSGSELSGVEDVLPDEEARLEFWQLAQEHGAVRQPSR